MVNYTKKYPAKDFQIHKGKKTSLKIWGIKKLQICCIVEEALI